MGGDEFVIILWRLMKKSMFITEKIRKYVVEYYSEDLKITTSIGLAEVNIDMTMKTPYCRRQI